MKPLFKTVWMAVLVLVGLLAGAGESLADAWDRCETETARSERTNNIPRHLLTAISLAESGRWSKERREILAWPWTVTNGGEGKFFPTKRAAIEEVRRLMAKGETNIDVGCMQVNLRHHGDNFVSLDHAFDPAANVAYATKFLTRLFDETKSWTKAASYYHSRTPEYSERYRKKVVRLWNEKQRERVVTADFAAKPRTAPTPAAARGGDPRALMARLNESFRERGGRSLTSTVNLDAAPSAAPSATMAAARAETTDEPFLFIDGRVALGEEPVSDAPEEAAGEPQAVSAQVAAWRNGGSGGLSALKQRLRKEREFEKKWKTPRDEAQKDRFAAKRHKQLQVWRLNLPGAGGDG